ncbi:hypothetical protein [Thermincola potens]|uniref:Uncharacterized protein n=1 Tax=Thermincola potens (strain JR) TaxID=635013 RepID=D5XE45_THEPJ|nr:hypothetical protein [Thermincola potens]ADG81916.1 hypothetical protein TherJR_1051 [Thermincola potens JR]
MACLTRTEVIDRIEKYLARKISAADIGWWAFDIFVEANIEYEPGHERILKDVIQALQHFHDDDPLMRQFYPEEEDLIYYLRCLKGEEMYNPQKIPHWNV